MGCRWHTLSSDGDVEDGCGRTGHRETGGSFADRIFFVKYSLSFLQHWYTTYPPPQKDTTTTGSSVVSPSSVGGDTDITGENTSGVTDSNFPHMSPRKVVVFNYYTLLSDDLISSGPNSGQYTDTFKCNIKDEAYKQNRLFQPYRGLGHRYVN